MALHKVLAIMMVLAATDAVRGGSMCNSHSSFGDITRRCFQSADISSEEAMTFWPGNEGMFTVSTQDLEQMCARKNKYIQAHECINDHAQRCPKAASMNYARHLDDAFRMMNMTCSDPNINLECIAALFKNVAELGPCMEEVKKSYTDIHGYIQELMSPEEEKCYTGMAYKICSIQLLRACDVYTANQYDHMLNMFVPRECPTK